MRRKFLLCVDRLDKDDQKVWAVRISNKWLTARAVNVCVPVTTIFRGRSARQPKAYLTGWCDRLTIDHRTSVISIV